MLKYTTIVYSAPKKSGKSALASAVIMYMAFTNPNSYLACMANDGKQADDRLYGPVRTCLRLHQQYGGPLANETYTERFTLLSNYSKIEPITVDAAGEAGSQPIVVAFCYDDKTEILTRDGWKRYNEYTMDDEFLTLAPDGTLEYQKPLALHITPYTGKMHLLDTRRVSLCVSPNHKLYGKFSHDMSDAAPLSKLPVEQVKDKARYGVRVESNGFRASPAPDEVIIPGTKRKPDLHIPIKLYLRLLGWYLAEGCTHKGDTVLLAQKSSSAYYNELKELVEELGYVPHEWSGTDAVIFYDSRLAKHLKQFGLAHEKFIPEWVKHLPQNLYAIFYEAYWRGDGHKTEEAIKKHGAQITSTNSPRLRDDLMEVAILHGRYVTCTEYQDKRWGRPLFKVSIKKFKGGSRVIGSHRKYWKDIDYAGIIHCPSVPNGIVCIRRNGKVHFQGQSELWGYRTPKKKALYTEMTIPPTLYGRAIRWVETYAGYTGESDLLEQLYDVGFTNGIPHPDFDDLITENGPAVRVNPRAKTFVYWDTEPRMVWQTEDYYIQEAQMLPPAEFERIHHNKWVSSVSAFVESAWWDACLNTELLPLKAGDKTPVVVGIDMAVSRDCAAIVAVTRDPYDPGTKLAVRAVRVFSPKQHGGIIDQETLIRPVIEEWFEKWNVICWVYDPREMSKLAQDMSRAGYGWFKPFGQTTPRAISDKQLHDLVMHQQISWNPDTTEGDVGYKGTAQESLYKHITQAGAVTQGDAYRLEKLAEALKIDAAVALSQACFIALQLAITNVENNPQHLIKQLQNRQITTEEFSKRVRENHRHLERRRV